MNKHLFLSVRPEFTSKILSGTKSIEFRRTRPRVHEGQLVILYASSPTMAIVGVARIVSVTSGSPTWIWNNFRNQGGIQRDRFRVYFHGAQQGHAIELSEAIPLETALPLAMVRKAIPGFHPPQTFAYLTDKQIALLGLRPACQALRS